MRLKEGAAPSQALQVRDIEEDAYGEVGPGAKETVEVIGGVGGIRAAKDGRCKSSTPIAIGVELRLE